MIHVGFTRPITIGAGRAALTVRHEVVPMPPANAAALAAANPGAVVDLTPRDFGFPVFAPHRLSAFCLAPCPVCAGQRRITACRNCNGRGRVMEIR